MQSAAQVSLDKPVFFMQSGQWFPIGKSSLWILWILMIYRISSVIRPSFFSFQKSQNPDMSYKKDLDL